MDFQEFRHKIIRYLNSTNRKAVHGDQNDCDKDDYSPWRYPPWTKFTHKQRKLLLARMVELYHEDRMCQTLHVRAYRLACAELRNEALVLKPPRIPAQAPDHESWGSW